MSKAIENSEKLYKKVKDYGNMESNALAKKYSQMMQDTTRNSNVGIRSKEMKNGMLNLDNFKGTNLNFASGEITAEDLKLTKISEELKPLESTSALNQLLVNTESSELSQN